MTLLEKQRTGAEDAPEACVSSPARVTPPHPVGGPQPLCIFHLVSSLQVGGMEQFVLRIAAEQQQQGHRVTIIGLQGGPLLEQARRLGVKAMVLEGGKIGRISRALAGMA